MKTGYKVLSAECYSVVARYPVLYRQNIPTRPAPGCGPLTVFKTLEDAARWTFMFPDIRVWECEYKPWSKPLPLRDGVHIALWMETKWELEYLFVSDLPSGTDLAEEVIITNDLRAEQGFTLSAAERHKPVHTEYNKVVYRSLLAAEMAKTPGTTVWHCMYFPYMPHVDNSGTAAVVVLQQPILT